MLGPDAIDLDDARFLRSAVRHWLRSGSDVEVEGEFQAERFNAPRCTRRQGSQS